MKGGVEERGEEMARRQQSKRREKREEDWLMEGKKDKGRKR